jgi:hypothetical protein
VIAPAHWRGSAATLLAVIAFAPLTTGFAGCSHTLTVDRDAYVAANHRLFSQLPKFPSERSLREVSTAYRHEEDDPVAGYTTRFELALPPQATARTVGGFFAVRLSPRWRLVENLHGRVLNFRRGKAYVSINLDNIRLHRLEVAVDHALDGKLGP